MKKYDSILKRVEQVEYKLGISYAKTGGKLYKSMWIVALLGVIYLTAINSLLILSDLSNGALGGNRIFTNQTIVFIGLSTVFEIVAIVFAKKSFKVIGTALGLIPIPYLSFIFIKFCYSYGEGLWNLKTIFYVRHLPSLVLITISFAFMLFIALREVIKVNRSYKRIMNNLYSNYMNEHKNDTLDVSDSDWEEFIENYSPKNAFDKK